jgi:hypothetical protein
VKTIILVVGEKKMLISLKKGIFYLNNKLNYNIGYVII